MTSTPPTPPAVPSSVTLHSSWRGVAASGLGATAVFGAGMVGVVLGGWRLLPTGLLALGTLFLATVLFDYPVATTFDSDGVTRRMLLRRHRIGWDRIDQLTRSRPGFASNLRGVRHGGLTAAVGRRRYLLVDQPESPEEYDVVCAVAGERMMISGCSAGCAHPTAPTRPGCTVRSDGGRPRTAERRTSAGVERRSPPVAWSTVRDVMLYITLVINVVSMGALIAGILMHSGRGGGLSDMFGGGGGAALGSTAAERNLNRITFVFALVWIFTLVALSFLFEAV